MRILICEDNVIATMLVEQVLEEAGHHVVGIAPSAAIALAKSHRNRPDLALVDLNLADGHTGETLVDMLANLGIPSIVITGHRGPIDDASRARAVLSKPIQEHQLLSAIARVEEGWV